MLMEHNNYFMFDLWIMKPCRCVASQAFHCAEPGSRHVACLPLFMSLLTYEVYYHSDTAEGNISTEVNCWEEKHLFDCNCSVGVSAGLTVQRFTKIHVSSVVRVFSRSHWPPYVTTDPGWSRHWLNSRSAHSSSAACALWALRTCSVWLLTPQAATSSRP